MRNSVKLGFPTFVVLGKGRPALEEFTEEVDGWLPLLPEIDMPPLTGDGLVQVVRRKTATAGSLEVGDGWSSSLCLFPGLMVLLVSLLRLRSLGFGLRGCWMRTLQ